MRDFVKVIASTACGYFAYCFASNSIGRENGVIGGELLFGIAVGYVIMKAFDAAFCIYERMKEVK